ncbi:MAG: hypothetical protein OXJ52_01365 [Oligoflexia bacterium]|nr:hypothetical protein [Oligoflexia bacterium]
MDDLKRRLLDGYKKLYEQNPEQWYGAVKISNRLNLSEDETGSHHAKVHYILDKLCKRRLFREEKRSRFQVVVLLKQEKRF